MLKMGVCDGADKKEWSAPGGPSVTNAVINCNQSSGAINDTNGDEIRSLFIYGGIFKNSSTSRNNQSQPTNAR